MKFISVLVVDQSIENKGSNYKLGLQLLKIITTMTNRDFSNKVKRQCLIISSLILLLLSSVSSYAEELPKESSSESRYVALCRNKSKRNYPKGSIARIELLATYSPKSSFESISLGTVTNPHTAEINRISSLPWYEVLPDGNTGKVHKSQITKARLTFVWNEPDLEEKNQTPVIGSDSAKLILGRCYIPGTIYSNFPLIPAEDILANTSPSDSELVKNNVEGKLTTHWAECKPERCKDLMFQTEKMKTFLKQDIGTLGVVKLNLQISENLNDSWRNGSQAYWFFQNKKGLISPDNWLSMGGYQNMHTVAWKDNAKKPFIIVETGVEPLDEKSASSQIYLMEFKEDNSPSILRVEIDGAGC